MNDKSTISGRELVKSTGMITPGAGTKVVQEMSNLLMEY